MDEIARLGVSSKIIAALKVAKIVDFKSVLRLSHDEIFQLTNLSYQEVSLLVKAVSQKMLTSTLVTALQLQKETNSRQKISLGCRVLDDMFRGGIRTHGITEICGESASGKTQLCLQLSLVAQLSSSVGGLAGGVLYISTECSFPIKRLHQLITNIAALKTVDSLALTDNITICQIGDISELKQCTQKYLPLLVKARQIRVIIIDSVAALFRAAYDKNEIHGRAENLQALGYSLHCLSQKEELAVVCVNQVTDTMSDSHSWCGPMEKVAPSLGLSWANMISTRVMLSRTSQKIDVLHENGRIVRLSTPAVICKAEIIYAPDLPRECAHYVVTQGGLKSVYLQACSKTHFGIS